LLDSERVIFNGLRLGLVFALLGVIGAKILASEHGLGQTLSVWEGDFLAGCIVLTIRSSIARPLDTALPWTLVLSQEPDAPQSVIQAIY
jgi:hypothetical protein